jgi:hypothetical protein
MPLSYISSNYNYYIIIDVYLSKLVIKTLAVSIVEIGLSDLTIITGGSSIGSTNLARYTS